MNKEQVLDHQRHCEPLTEKRVIDYLRAMERFGMDGIGEGCLLSLIAHFFRHEELVAATKRLLTMQSLTDFQDLWPDIHSALWELGHVEEDDD